MWKERVHCTVYTLTQAKCAWTEAPLQCCDWLCLKKCRRMGIDWKTEVVWPRQKDIQEKHQWQNWHFDPPRSQKLCIVLLVAKYFLFSDSRTQWWAQTLCWLNFTSIHTMKMQDHINAALSSTQAKNTFNISPSAYCWVLTAVLTDKIHRCRDRYFPKPDMLVCTKETIKPYRNLPPSQRESSLGIEMVF